MSYGECRCGSCGECVDWITRSTSATPVPAGAGGSTLPGVGLSEGQLRALLGYLADFRRLERGLADFYKEGGCPSAANERAVGVLDLVRLKIEEIRKGRT